MEEDEAVVDVEQLSENEDDSPTTPAGPAKRKLKGYSLLFKLEVIKFAKETSKNSAAKKYNINRKRVREWVENEVKLRELAASLTEKGEKNCTCYWGRRPQAEAAPIAASTVFFVTLISFSGTFLT